ncbi:tetratricopeptide repeat protein [Deferribacter thermophilus]|uniref:tetratricopeptide repeat protein n=1 Tax=Deferribacter thermophilus TaxID=53573 RepID=UPI003C1A0A0C
MKKITNFILILFILFGCVQKVDKLKLAESHYKLGLAYLGSENDFRALGEFEEALKYNPKDDRVYYAISAFYLKKNMLDKAEKYIMKALTISPSNSEYLNAYASILAAKGDLSNAIVNWKKILNDPTYPNIPLVYYNIGLAYFNMKDYEEAKLYFENAIKANRFFANAYLMLYEIFMKEDKINEAEQILKQAVDNNPANRRLLLKLGEHYYNAKKLNEAASIFEDIVIKFPQSEEAKKASEYLKTFGIYK